jgi:hypothetical protein
VFILHHAKCQLLCRSARCTPNSSNAGETMVFFNTRYFSRDAKICVRTLFRGLANMDQLASRVTRFTLTHNQATVVMAFQGNLTCCLAFLCVLSGVEKHQFGMPDLFVMCFELQCTCSSASIPLAHASGTYITHMSTVKDTKTCLQVAICE